MIEMSAQQGFRDIWNEVGDIFREDISFIFLPNSQTPSLVQLEWSSPMEIYQAWEIFGDCLKRTENYVDFQKDIRLLEFKVLPEADGTLLKFRYQLEFLLSD